MKSELTNEHLITSFQTFLLTEKRVSKNTFLAYQKDIDQLFEFFRKNKLEFETCSKNHLKKFLKDFKKQGITAKTLSRKISSIKALFNFLNERYNIINKANNLIFPKIEQSLPSYLSEQELHELLKASNKDVSDKGIRNKTMLYLLYASGMRVSELVNLKVDQIHFDTGFVGLMGKGNKERLVPLPEKVLRLLRFYLDNVYNCLKPKVDNVGDLFKNNNYLFFSFYKGEIKPITRQSFWLILKVILLKANIHKDISPHTLRHSLATHLLKSGANIRSLQLLLGHEQLSTLQVYTHLEKTHVRKVYDKKHPRAK